MLATYLVLALAAVAAWLLLALMRPLLVERRRRRERMRIAPTPPGGEVLVGDVAEVIEELDPVGKVRVHGEIWDALAESDEAISVGSSVTVVRCEKMLLMVLRGDQP